MTMPLYDAPEGAIAKCKAMIKLREKQIAEILAAPDDGSAPRALLLALRSISLENWRQRLTELEQKEGK